MNKYRITWQAIEYIQADTEEEAKAAFQEQLVLGDIAPLDYELVVEEVKQ